MADNIKGQPNKDYSITGLICERKIKGDNKTTYFMVEDITPKEYDFYSNFLVLLDELGHSNGDLYGLISSKRVSIYNDSVDECRDANHRLVVQKQVSVVIDEDIILSRIDDMLDEIRIGISTLTGKQRAYDYLDYFQKIGLRSTIIMPIINANYDKYLFDVFRNFSRTKCLNTKKTDDEIKNVLTTKFTKDTKRDKNGKFILGSGKIVSEEAKRVAYHYILINDMPFSSALYLDVMDRAYRKHLDNDLIEEVYYRTKMNEINFIINDLKYFTSEQASELERVLGEVRNKVDFYSEKNKNRYGAYLEDLSQKGKFDYNNPYHVAISNICMRYGTDSESSNEVLDSDIRTVIEREQYEYRPIQKEFVSARTIGQKNNK